MKNRPFLKRSFFRGDPIECARELIGCELVWGECAGTIVETEAYAVLNDEACHTFARPSARAFVERYPAGTAYVYLNYGVHWLINVLVKGGREDGIILIRALEPTDGIDLMAKRRGRAEPGALCSGPGKLSQALAITGADHGRDLCSGRAVGFRGRVKGVDVIADTRIGISKAMHLPWRFLARESLYISVKPKSGVATPKK